MRGYCRVWPAILLGLLVQTSAWADDVTPPPPATPSFQFGVGVGAVRFPDYPGAEELRTLVLPFPYIVIRNRYLDVNRDHIRGKLLKDDRFSLDVDFGGQVSVDSSATQERRGMPDLDWLGEVGPSLRYHAWRDAEDETHFDLVLPLRVAVSAQGLTLHHRGWVTGPRAEWHKTLHLQDGDAVYLDSALSAEFVDRSYADYYYSVAPEFATATRPAYSAPGGYAGESIELGFSWHHGDMVYGAFVEHTGLHGAAFQSSPLVGRADGLSLGVAVSWIFQRDDSVQQP